MGLFAKSVLVVALAAFTGLITFYAGKGAAKSATPSSVSALTPQVPAQQVEPTARPGGKLTATELDAFRDLQANGTERQRVVDAKIRAWMRHPPNEKELDHFSLSLMTDNQSSTLRMTLWMRRIAAAHELEPDCFLGIGGDEAWRKRCGDRLWGFDPKTGDIQLAAK